MKLHLLYFLPSVYAARWYTNNGWSAPGAQSMCTADNKHTFYFCGQGALANGKNPFPGAFPHGRENCQISGYGCSWNGAEGSVCWSFLFYTS
ncbi:hypothetical protein GMOD_00000796 [Pyrenophora seminiperda CCB06]|uniref:Uncharacterized protein n=1 Tax=Pyrenophora seminiperda CCB06 TaxID=1302712 RepID=A0A3M7M880_9PLEO|nr:hypothetical protein GMOD_00000796 [Pyrenophora seminiperda CCB06]